MFPYFSVLGERASFDFIIIADCITLLHNVLQFLIANNIFRRYRFLFMFDRDILLCLYAVFYEKYSIYANNMIKKFINDCCCVNFKFHFMALV